MSPRVLPPVYSPLSARAIASGIAAMLRGGPGAGASVAAALRARYGSHAVALTDSGTSALALALRLAGARRPGRPVLLPGWGCFDLVTAALAAHVPVLFYDVDPATLGPDWSSLESAGRMEPAAAVAVHYYGLAVDWDRFEALLRPSGAVLIEDAAQGAGAEYRGRLTGSLGALSVLSFGRGKGMTGGKGGALLANDRSWLPDFERTRMATRRGGPGELAAVIAQWMLTRPSLYWLPAGIPWLGLGQTVLRDPHPVGGLSALAAGVVGTTMLLVDHETEVRRGHAEWLGERLRGGRLEVIREVGGGRGGWLRLPARLQSGSAQALTTNRRARALGIYPGYPKVLAELPGIRLAAPAPGMPGAEELVERLLTLPTHSAVRDPDLQRLVAWGLGRP